VVVSYVSVCLCFFFQAEDGIRDSSVTGVQTCALPICARGASLAPCVVHANGPTAEGRPCSGRTTWISTAHQARRSGCKAASRWRSEERSVGKEGRAGGEGE